MPRIAYIEKNFRKRSLAIIRLAQQIIEEYAAAGYDLTLRQLYYQFVSRDLIPNKDSEYKKLGSVINDARMAGMLDWVHIVDRTRNLRRNPHWESPPEILQDCADQFAIDKWADQSHYVEVWIEKDALVGVISGICKELDVPYFSCRGYSSQSEMWRAGQRLSRKMRTQKKPIILHLGDHDPSGIDMTRDIQDRLDTFTSGGGINLDANEQETLDDVRLLQANPRWSPEVRRIALTYDQVQEYGPPPNPAKLTDSRASEYVELYGYESWELDALEPQVISDLIRSTVLEYRNEKKWKAAVRAENKMRKKLSRIADQYDTLNLK